MTAFMIAFLIRPIANSLRRTFLNRRFWLGCALFILGLFALLHLLGFRRDTAILCGTFTDPSPTLAAARGLTYLLAYFAATVVAPILILAAILDSLLSRLGPKPSNAVTPPASATPESQVGPDASKDDKHRERSSHAP